MIRLLPLMLLVVAFSGRAVGGQEEATVTVEVSMSAAESLPDAHIDLLRNATGPKIDAVFHSFVAEHVSYGEYVLRVSRPGFKQFQHTLKVYQSRVSTRVRLSLANADDWQPLKIHGIVRSPDTRNLWVKLVPILNTDSLMETRVEDNGQFEFTGMNPGEYAVIIVRDEHVVLTKEISIPSVGAVQLTLQ